jgi:cytochrome c
MNKTRRVTMKKLFFYISVVVSFCIVFAPLAVMAEDMAALAKETEMAAAASASTKATSAMIIEKINAACALLSKEGRAGFRKFMGADSEFVFAGTYIWVHDMQGVMQMHPIKYKMVGKQLIGLKDRSGKLFFVDMNKVAKEQGAGWVDYMWPKPGEKKASKKVSYIKKCSVDGEDLVLGCGVYDLTIDDIKK